MALDPTERAVLFWSEVMRRTFSKGVAAITRQVLRAIKRGVPLETAVINVIMADWRQAATNANARIFQAAYRKWIFIDEPDLDPVIAIIQDRNKILNFNLANYERRAYDAASGFSRLGRQSQDIIRTMTLKELEKGFLKGQPSTYLRKGFIEQLNERASAQMVFDPSSPEFDKKALAKFTKEFPDKVPVFHVDGQPKFWLHTRPYNETSWRAYDAQFYSDLVSLTTTQEARWIATEDRAKRVGTRFIKVTRGSKSDAQYRAEGDEMCARINGKVFALENVSSKGGIKGAFGKSGKFYAWIRDSQAGINNAGGFVKPHPFCKHQASPLPERFA